MPRRLSRRAYLCILCLGDSISLHIYSFLVRRLNRRVYLCILVAGDSVAAVLFSVSQLISGVESSYVSTCFSGQLIKNNLVRARVNAV